MIIIDSTDPVGPATGLFSEEFYASVFDCLTGNGVFTAQTESPFLHKDLNKAYTQAKVFTKRTFILRFRHIRAVTGVLFLALKRKMPF